MLITFRNVKLDLVKVVRKETGKIQLALLVTKYIPSLDQPGEMEVDYSYIINENNGINTVESINPACNLNTIKSTFTFITGEVDKVELENNDIYLATDSPNCIVSTKWYTLLENYSTATQSFNNDLLDKVLI